jgi:hypothetical protein
MRTTNKATNTGPTTSTDRLLTSKGALWLAIVIFLISTFVVEYSVLNFTSGIITYPVDDTFIHLAIANNIAHYHVWGISPHGFESASSSILYPLILTALIKAFGPQIIIPFIINLITAIIFLFVLHTWLVRQTLNPSAQLCILLAVIILTPLPVIVLSGMEHTLQILFCFLFLSKFSDELAIMVSTPASKKNLLWPVFLYGFLLTGIRYEGIILVGMACFLLLFHRKLLSSVLLGFVSSLPVLIFGIYALAHGSYFFPNSVLLKSGAPPLTFDGLYSFFTKGMFDKLSLSTVGYITVSMQRMLIMLIITRFLFRTNYKNDLHYKYILTLLIGGVFFHLLFTGLGRFPRYEAYLIANGTIVIGTMFARFGNVILAQQSRTQKWPALALAVLLTIPVLMRAKDAFPLVLKASINIYQQQYQMGKFMGKYYHDTPIAFNDIGAISYFTKGNNLDLWGLGNLDITRSMKNNYYSPQFMDWLSKKDGVQVAVVFERYFPSQLREKWAKVGSWQVLDNVICADDSVSFYAVNSKLRDSLRKNLQAFQPSLPKGVIARYY